MMKKIFFLFLMVAFSLSGNPWGKDADLANRPKQSNSVSTCRTPILGTFGEWAIRFHQEVISPADGPRSHFKPSSSQYTLEAMRKYGFFRGYLMGCDRLMRENDERWVYETIRLDNHHSIKYDPVP